MLKTIKENIATIVAETISIDSFDCKTIINMIQKCPKQEVGDYGIPCFLFSKELKKNPNEIAKNIVETIKKNIFDDNEFKECFYYFFEEINYFGSYVNFKISMNILKIVLQAAVSDENWGNYKCPICDFIS